ncbi:MAG: sigma-54 dependent transcriptional regulator [Syntrophales bacterium]|jgi:DNA-binding NtrC family response regulator|nr:sigma-54 dependent transcriptional regulator [Syntrophales bacterium]MDY0045739.1 sigma-54 dependent transcriptional regulator [Syntrophales bacterium]
MKIILVATTDKQSVQAVRESFQAEYRIERAESAVQCLEMFGRKRCEYLFIDIEFLEHLQQENEIDPLFKSALMNFWRIFPTAQIIVLTSPEHIRKAVMAVKGGASNYITRPVNKDELNHITENVYRTLLMKSELHYLRGRYVQKSADIIHTESPMMRGAIDKLMAVAPLKTTVFLTGETGTGKSVLARIIHQFSNRSERQFIQVHCGAIQDTLLESELFGHEKGAFTGADRRKLGKFEIADKGTIFLDEVGTLTPSAQIKLLQVLQEETLQRVGSEADIPVDIRVIAAANTDLEQMIREGGFRNDLFYRLSVFPIEVPPLRERIEDIPLLTDSFLKELNRANTKTINNIDPRVMEIFRHYPWPGNIRELKNIIERAFIIEKSEVITVSSIPKELSFGYRNGCHMPRGAGSLAEVKDTAVKEYLMTLLTEFRGNIQKTADDAGISTRQVHKLMKKYDLQKENFRM